MVPILAAVLILVFFVYGLFQRYLYEIKHEYRHKYESFTGENEDRPDLQKEQKTYYKGSDYSYWDIKLRIHYTAKLKKLVRIIYKSRDGYADLIPAVNWLVDNYYVINREQSNISRSIHRKTIRKLPYYANGRRVARIYHLANRILNSHSFHVNDIQLVQAINRFQEKDPLLGSEIWLMPLILKLCMLEHITALAEKTVKIIRQKKKADRILKEAMESSNIEGYLIKKLSKSPEDTKKYLSHIFYRCQEMDSEETNQIKEIIERLYLKEENVNDVISSETSEQAHLQVRITSLIMGLNDISSLLWEDIYLQLSKVESVLANDPTGVYNRCNFKTKVAYHKKIEEIARKTGLKEWDIASKIVARCKERVKAADSKPGKEDKSVYIGYYLINRNFNQIISDTYKGNLKSRFAFYALSVVLFGLILTGFFTRYLFGYPVFSWKTLLLVVTGFPLGYQISKSLVNDSIGKMSKQGILPQLDYRFGIPDESRTVAVIPVITDSKEKMKEYIEKLKIYWLANRDKNLYMAVLADFKDYKEETAPYDRELMEYAKKCIQEVSDSPEIKAYFKDKSGIENRFMVFFRKRLYNPKQHCWMGYERKRGKLEEFNALLRGSKDTTFFPHEYDEELLQSIKYVITVDADTELNKGTAHELCGIIAHPLNKAVVDESRSRVIDGYGIIQPKVGVRMENALATRFSKLFAGLTGIDCYSSQTYDLYQDYFEEGIFTGKGIYDVDAFHTVLGKKLPENAILSHDLLESCYLRAAYAGDIMLMDGFPTTPIAFFKREHRWIRGDWQLLPWLSKKKGMSCLSRFKIADNLIRSLYPVSQIWILLFCIFTEVPVLKMLFVIFAGDLILLTKDILVFLWVKIRTATVGIFVSNFYETLGKSLSKLFFNFLFLPLKAHIAVDAVLRTLFRLYISKRNLLEWQTAEACESLVESETAKYVVKMIPSIGIGLFLMLYPIVIMKSEPVFKSVLGVFLVLSPFITAAIGRKIEDKEELPLHIREDIRFVARKVWGYFEYFMIKNPNRPVPDNCQIIPTFMQANRTSPTNLGFQLLSGICALDMGFIGVHGFLEITENLVDIMTDMEKWNGHLFNWYDTVKNKVLPPGYVSTADSGNLAACLIVAIEALKELPQRKWDQKDILDAVHMTKKLADFKENAFDEDADLVSLLDCVLKDRNRQGKSAEWTSIFYEMCERFQRDVKTLLKDGTISITHANEEDKEALLKRIDTLTEKCRALLYQMDFSKLYDSKKHLFHIGYNSTTGEYDRTHYDLLASEARLASYLAIARNQVPLKHWFKLGRPFTVIRRKATLLSWSGTMFEYLLPSIFLKQIKGSMMDVTCRKVIEKQIEYCLSKNVPWGISESGYYKFDKKLNYQYRAFGVPGIGLRSDIKKSLVIAPYACFIAMPFAVYRAYDNMHRLREYGGEDMFGFYEAMDFMEPAKNMKPECKLIKSYMIHHQGMTLAAFNNLLNDFITVKRFNRNDETKSVDLILEERSPSGLIVKDDPVIVQKPYKEEAAKPVKADYRRIGICNPKYPVCHVISNNGYTVMLTSTGEGFSKYGDKMINRWKSDSIGQPQGIFIYIRLHNENKMWSTSYMPVCLTPDRYSVEFHPDRAEFLREDFNIETKTEITVSPKHNVEIRKVSIINRRKEKADMDATLYFEPVLDLMANDNAHPAFSKMFLSTEYVRDKNVLLVRRRPRQGDEKERYAFLTCITDGRQSHSVEYETDRYQFLGRHGSLRSPNAMKSDLPLSNNAGNRLDTVMAERVHLSIPPGKKAVFFFIIGVADSAKEATAIAELYQNSNYCDDIFNVARVDSEVEMKYLGLDKHKVNQYLNLVGSLYYPSRLLRGPVDVLKQNVLGQKSFWKYGISGDHPIILVKIYNEKDLPTVKEMVSCYEYFNKNGIDSDLVILTDESSGYHSNLSNRIRDILADVKVFYPGSVNKGIHILSTSEVEKDFVTLVTSVARIVIDSKSGFNLKKTRRILYEDSIVKKEVIRTQKTEFVNEELPMENLKYYNGIGGFSYDGNEYVIHLRNRETTPLPWINVIANKIFGFTVTESGGGYTWFKNSRENKLSAWRNDPVTDMPSEIVYVYDMSSGRLCSPTALPVRDDEEYRIRHGYGYTTFLHNTAGLSMTMNLFADKNDPVKIYWLNIRNNTDATRSVVLYFYVDLVLGVDREVSAPYILTEMDIKNNIFYAKNSYTEDFKNHIAFIGCSETVDSWTGDKTEFIGKSGSLRSPISAYGVNLSCNVGAGYIPCGVISVNCTLQANSDKHIAFMFGQSDDYAKIIEMCSRYSDIANVAACFDEVKRHNMEFLNRVRVNTPDDSFNTIMNGHLMYQNLVCRMYARSAYYQSGGAYGFRDQLQDTLSLLYFDPSITREQIIRCCMHQFTEGDVLHWWHDEDGRGVRTKISDDLLWLPYVLSYYIKVTGDTSILKEKVYYIQSDLLGEKEHESYKIPEVSSVCEDVYMHCKRAIDKGYTKGERGIALMGGGDWNDGMNRVGIRGKGESVWLTWFLITVMREFIPIAIRTGDCDYAEELLKRIEEYKDAINRECWDGNWFVRAYCDDGSVIGSKNNSECMIDSISQSWAVISDGTDSERKHKAMESVAKYLVDKKERLVKLLTPPFERFEPNPGYIRGYFPGIRENGGQYTHGAVWNIVAYTKLGKGDEAYELFNLINPVNHTGDYWSMMKYKTEPYAVAADVYSSPEYSGRGGWSWYTGSAGWLYQAGLNYILGIRIEDGHIVVEPCVPRNWKTYSVYMEVKDSKFFITVQNPYGVCQGPIEIMVDGMKYKEGRVPVDLPGNMHSILVTILRQ
jgi:cyclic beta-1,2-glucan synthetase